MKIDRRSRLAFKKEATNVFGHYLTRRETRADLQFLVAILLRAEFIVIAYPSNDQLNWQLYAAKLLLWFIRRRLSIGY